ncbi:hypothetical protein Q7O_002985 [Pectobacterium carotovorum subsp. carotovorum PCCS1]|nr:hypothetical protein [Pectobacterium carotovorum subsp. carotovorum PCCS1]
MIVYRHCHSPEILKKKTHQVGHAKNKIGQEKCKNFRENLFNVTLAIVFR